MLWFSAIRLGNLIALASGMMNFLRLFFMSEMGGVDCAFTCAWNVRGVLLMELYITFTKKLILHFEYCIRKCYKSTLNRRSVALLCISDIMLIFRLIRTPTVMLIWRHDLFLCCKGFSGVRLFFAK